MSNYSQYQFIHFKVFKKEDNPEVTLLKSQYNRLGAHINIHWPTLSLDQRQQIYDQLNQLEEKIKTYE